MIPVIGTIFLTLIFSVLAPQKKCRDGSLCLKLCLNNALRDLTHRGKLFMSIKKLATFEDMGFIQWGVLNEDETGIYSATSLEEAFFTPLPETLLEFIQQGNNGLLSLVDALSKRRAA